MPAFLVRRCGIAVTPLELDAALLRLRAYEAGAGARPVQWWHSYVLHEAEGDFGLACVCRAESATALREHAAATQLPADEILPIDHARFGRAFAPNRVLLVRRRGAWANAAAFVAGEAGADECDGGTLAPRVVWLNSYAVREADGTVGSVGLYQAIDAGAMAAHAAAAGHPAESITAVVGRIVLRAQPLDAAADAWPPVRRSQ
jgi:hypothetical protein